MVSLRLILSGWNRGRTLDSSTFGNLMRETRCVPRPYHDRFGWDGPQFPFRSGLQGWNARIPGRSGQGRIGSAVSAPALVSGWNIHVFAIFGDGAAGEVNALRLQHGGELIVGERMARVFVFNELAHLALEHQERSVGALGAV